MIYLGGNFSCYRYLLDIVYYVLMMWINGVFFGDFYNVFYGVFCDVFWWLVDNLCDVLGIYVGKLWWNSS